MQTLSEYDQSWVLRNSHNRSTSKPPWTTGSSTAKTQNQLHRHYTIWRIPAQYRMYIGSNNESDLTRLPTKFTTKQSSWKHLNLISSMINAKKIDKVIIFLQSPSQTKESISSQAEGCLHLLDAKSKIILFF